jgi:hypothetical protein
MEKITMNIAAANIKTKTFSYVGTTTICTIEMINGWKEVGTSDCVNPSDYDISLGEKYSLEQATVKVLEKLSFLGVDKQYNFVKNKTLANPIWNLSSGFDSVITPANTVMSSGNFTGTIQTRNITPTHIGI